MDYNEVCTAYTDLLTVVNNIADQMDEAYGKAYKLEDEHRDTEAEAMRNKAKSLNDDYEKLGECLDRLFAVRSSMELYMDTCDLHSDALEKYSFND